MARVRGTAALAPTVGPDGAATARLRLPGGGPHDADTLDADFTPAAGTLDFGAVRVPVPADGTVALEPSSEGRMQAVHVTFAQGRLSVSALAAPRNDGLWPDLATEIDASLREGGARVRSFTGAWGRELHATTDGATSVFIGVDGPRWMLYGVATGPTRDAVALDARLRRMLRGTVVVRGKAPYPVRTVLPLVAPSEVDADNPDTPSQAPTMTLRTPAPSGAVTATGVADAMQESRPADSGGPRAIGAGTKAKANGVPQAPAAFRGAAVNSAGVNSAGVNSAGVNSAGVARTAGVNGDGANRGAARTAGVNGAVANRAVANGTGTNGGLTNGVKPPGAYPSGAYPSGAHPYGVTPQGPAAGSYRPGRSPSGPSTNGAVPNPAATGGTDPSAVSYRPTSGATPFGAATNGVTSPGTYPPGPGLYGAPPATGAGPAGASTSGGNPTGPATYGAPATGAGPAGVGTSGGYPTSAITYGAPAGAPPSGGATKGATSHGATPYGATPRGATPYGATPAARRPTARPPAARRLTARPPTARPRTTRPPTGQRRMVRVPMARRRRAEFRTAGPSTGGRSIRARAAASGRPCARRATGPTALAPRPTPHHDLGELFPHGGRISRVATSDRPAPPTSIRRCRLLRRPVWRRRARRSCRGPRARPPLRRRRAASPKARRHRPTEHLGAQSPRRTGEPPGPIPTRSSTIPAPPRSDPPSSDPPSSDQRRGTRFSTRSPAISTPCPSPFRSGLMPQTSRTGVDRPSPWE